MCGIIAGLADSNIEPILLNGLNHLEYRGYDSAGLAVSASSRPARHRVSGKVKRLKVLCEKKPLLGRLGIAHTRWATHGKPTVANAHPHICNDSFALVHNGIIENHDELKQQQCGYRFTSDTDSEVLVHQIDLNFTKKRSLLAAVQQTVDQIEGSYAFAVFRHQHQELVATRHGSPLILGVGQQGCFVASDTIAIAAVADMFVFLEEEDVVVISDAGYQIYDKAGRAVTRKQVANTLTAKDVSKQGYKHFMLKEIFEQPKAIEQTLAGRLSDNGVAATVFGNEAETIFRQIKQIQIVACGTSYHAGLIGKYWLERILNIACMVEVASEYRYRHPVLLDDTLLIFISQSGETADTIAALKSAKKQNKRAHSLTISNVAESTLVRLSDLVFLTQAGREIGVASTKAFTSQLVALMLLVIALGRSRDLAERQLKKLISGLQKLADATQEVLHSATEIKNIASHFASKYNALFLGRGIEYPVALEGALKLKEISYIHAEAYPAGELKHGPLALVDDNIPVIAVAPNNALLKKLKANIEEVKARGGELFVFADSGVYFKEQKLDSKNFHLINVAQIDEIFSPIIFIIPLQLLAYYVALIKGTDVDQPRNLAKAVTVE